MCVVACTCVRCARVSMPCEFVCASVRVSCVTMRVFSCVSYHICVHVPLAQLVAQLAVSGFGVGPSLCPRRSVGEASRRAPGLQLGLGACEGTRREGLHALPHL